MKLYNTLLRKIEDFKPLHDKEVTIYSCGPTVYDHIHIGNLASFIYADTLNRVLRASGYDVQHVMNFTDVDDKTIQRGQEKYPDLDPKEALKKLTDEYSQIFLEDMKSVGNDVSSIKFINATDHIEEMKALITKLHEDGFAYIADDGVYFSIKKYRDSGKKYGQLLDITESSTSSARIQNDEYDKDSPHDFALWKTAKTGEPTWQFTLDGKKLDGRPGWHIECSAMSADALGQPFDIHTGGVDLIFPHHENEIAQSTAGNSNPVLANVFFHNEHLLVDGKKMSKSLNNFFTLQNIKDKTIDPLAFRLMVLQSHYRSQSNFTWDNLRAAQNRLQKLQNIADKQFQLKDTYTRESSDNNLSDSTSKNIITRLTNSLINDLDTPKSMEILSDLNNLVDNIYFDEKQVNNFKSILSHLDNIFSLQLTNREDISPEIKAIISKREALRDKQDWENAGKLRDALQEQGIGLNDTPHGTIWYRL